MDDLKWIHPNVKTVLATLEWRDPKVKRKLEDIHKMKEKNQRGFIEVGWD